MKTSIEIASIAMCLIFSALAFGDGQVLKTGFSAAEDYADGDLLAHPEWIAPAAGSEDVFRIEDGVLKMGKGITAPNRIVLWNRGLVGSPMTMKAVFRIQSSQVRDSGMWKPFFQIEIVDGTSLSAKGISLSVCQVGFADTMFSFSLNQNLSGSSNRSLEIYGSTLGISETDKISDLLEATVEVFPANEKGKWNAVARLRNLATGKAISDIALPLWQAPESWGSAKKFLRLNTAQCNEKQDSKRVSITGLALSDGTSSLSAKMKKEWALPQPEGKPVPFIHVTDWFHPHADPDDHWDAATVFALHCAGFIDLKAVCYDSTRSAVLSGKDKRGIGDPAVLSLAQLQRITGVSVPFAVGSSRLMKHPNDTQSEASRSDTASVRLILQVLEESEEPVAIGINGSSRDVGIAVARNPELFQKKCRGIYVLGGRSAGKRTETETNVSLDPAAFATVFSAPCPVFWLPGFGDVDAEHRPIRDDFDSYFATPYAPVLITAGKPLLNYLRFMHQVGYKFRPAPQDADLNWLRSMDHPDPVPSLRQFHRRAMWTTPGYLDAAGLAVEQDGTLVLKKRATSPAYSFDPIRITIGSNGSQIWSRNDPQANRFVLHKHNKYDYLYAMPKAVTALMRSLTEPTK